MHELGYAVQLVDTLKDFMKENGLSVISSVTLDVGEATAIVPRFFYDCWPAAIDEEPTLSNCELKINFIKARGRCHDCENEYIISEHHGHCPKCGCEDYDFLSGYEFEISEIRGK